MARKKKIKTDELEELDQTYTNLTGRKKAPKQRRFRGLGFLLLLLATLAAGIWYLLQLFPV